MSAPKTPHRLSHFPTLRWIAGIPSGADRADLVHPADVDDVPTQPAHWDDAPGAAATRSCERLIGTYSAHGGLLIGDRVVELLRQRRPQPLSVLARWIVEREVVWFSHDDRLHLPMFQFHRGDMTVRTAVSDVLRTLRPVMDDTAIADWFVTPNGYAKGRSPLEWIEVFPLVVSRAAWLERATRERPDVGAR